MQLDHLANKIPCTFLFSGTEEKEEAAETFAKTLTTPFNIHHYRPEGKSSMHTIASMQELIKEVSLPPFEAKYKVFIIHDADRMLPTSSNALLKTLEEPPADTVIILIAKEPQSLLPTIFSRCSHVPFFSPSKPSTHPWDADLEAFLNGTADATKLDTYFSDLKEEDPLRWHKEVEFLFEQVFSRNKTEKNADLIQTCLDAVHAHLKLKHILDYFKS